MVKLLQVYIAGRYSLKPQFRKWREDLNAQGIECTSQWLDEDIAATFEGSTAEELQKHSVRDVQDVSRSDALVLHTHERRTVRSGGGRFVEFGIAFALSKPVIIVGPAENVFCLLPGVSLVDTWGQALALLRRPSVLFCAATREKATYRDG